MLCPCCGSPVPQLPPAEQVARTLAGTQAAVVRALAANFGDFVPTQRLIARVWADDPDGGPMAAQAVVANAIFRIRPKLAKQGLAVDGRQYLGYRVRAA